MSDLIRRQKALDALGEKPVGDTDWDLGCRNQWEWDTEILRTIPSAEPERKWIPVSERLPKEKKYVLVTTIDDDMKVSWVTDVNYWWNIGRGKVIAWMPLPEPWRGDR